MMQINDIKLRELIDESELQQAREIYLDAFPPAEQRSWESITGGCGGRLHLNGIFAGQQLVGMITTWDFEHFIYIEHFVINPTLRSYGLGSKALKVLQQTVENRPLLLEVEPEHISEEAVRRIKFYDRLGFKIISRSYVQPPYDTYLPPVHLWLMSTDGSTDADEASLLLHTQVYGVTVC